MVNFGYPYNDIVICKDSTDYLGDQQTLAAYMQNGRGWADRRLSMVGGGEGALPPP